MAKLSDLTKTRRALLKPFPEFDAIHTDLDAMPEQQFQNILEGLQVEREMRAQAEEQARVEAEAAEYRRIDNALHFAPYFDELRTFEGRNSTYKGYIPDMDHEEYCALKAVNAGLLKSPTPCEMLNALTAQRVDDFDSPVRAYNFTMGTILHWVVLEPWKFDAKHRDTYMRLSPTEGLATKAAQDARREDPEVMLVTPDMIEKAHYCMDAVRAHPLAVELLSKTGLREPTGVTYDTDNEVWRKWRPDFLPANEDYILDVKTTDLDLWDWSRVCWKMGYFQQAAWYLDCHFLMTGERRTRFIWVAVTKSEPFMCRVMFMRNLPSSDPAYAESAIRKARERIGLEDSERLARLPMFINSAKQTISARERGIKLTRPYLRQLWPAYEEEEMPEIWQ